MVQRTKSENLGLSRCPISKLVSKENILKELQKNLSDQFSETGQTGHKSLAQPRARVNAFQPPRCARVVLGVRGWKTPFSFFETNR